MARIIYPGLEDYLYASLTIGHGITPGIGTIYVPWRPGRTFKKIGNLTFQDGSGSVTFPNCTIDSVSVEVDDQGFQIAAATILDRRWKWRTTGQISGFYNIRRGKDLVAYSKKNARELAKLCLTAMGEVGFDLSRMPDNTFPEVAWEYTLPAQALVELCEAVGCRIVLTLQNRVVIRRVGVGALLPPDFLHAAQTLDPPELPSELIFVGHRTQFELNAPLEAVIPKLNGDIIKLDSAAATYFGLPAPHHWHYFHPDNAAAIPDAKKREHVKKWAFKLYRVITPGEFLGRQVSELKQILPMEREQVLTEWINTGASPTDKEPRRRPWKVWGKFATGNGEINNISGAFSSLAPDLEARPEYVYQRGASLFSESGLVQFSEPVYQYHKGGPDVSEVSRWAIRPADLRLRTTVGYRNKNTLAWEHRQVKRSLGNQGTKPEYVVRDDVELQYYFAGTDLKHNEPEYDKQAKYYLDARMLELQNPQPASATYAGFRGINLDGAIQQVTFEVDRQGYAYTRASRNREESFVTPSYQERRQWERQRALEVATAKLKRRS